ncbi:unnamed protein product, partial [Porites lobata]
ERGKRKEERGRRKAESGKRKEERGSRKVSQNMVSSSEPSVNQTLNLRSINSFQDRLTFLNRHTVVWIGWDS